MNDQWSLTPLITAINTSGALVTSSLKGEDPTWNVTATAVGTVLGVKAGDVTSTFMKNAAISTAIRYESPSLINAVTNSVAPISGISGSVVQEQINLFGEAAKQKYGNK